MTDAEARQAIRTKLDVTMLVEAAAGTGKTTSLVDRMVNLVRNGKARASSIAAITFTVKAAAQLRERFQEAVERASREERQISIFLRDALEEIDRGFIGTTHAFCARLLRERPVEAGLDPEFEELDEVAARRATAEFWNRWYEEENIDGNPLLAEALEVGLDRKSLRGAFERVVEYPDVVLASERSERPDLRRVVDALLVHLDQIEPHLPEDKTHKPDVFEKMIVTLLRQRRSADLDDPFEQFVFLDEANHAKHKPTQKLWPDGKTAKRLWEAYADFVNDELRPAVQRWREHVHGIALEVLRPAAAAFAAERRLHGTLTFQDLLVCARDMLRDHIAVRRYFQRRFTHLLVDEFQDTDPLQAEILFYLTGEELAEKNWRKLRPRPGSLFIVGDPKQSIYRFRRADITTYLDVRRRIDEGGGLIVELSTNFRSTPVICTFVNDAFSTLFTAADVEAGRQAPHIVAQSGASGGGRTGIYSLESTDTESEAAWVADWILRSVGEELRFSDILLVSWQRPRLALFARAFERARIPYEITGSKAFKDAGALADALPLLRAIADPDDEISIVAFLRGPLSGADDDALYRFVQAGGKFSPFKDVPAGADQRIAVGLAILRDAIADAKKHPPAATIARVIERIGLLPLAASHERPGTRTGNLLLALNIARESSSRGESLAAIVEQFEDLLDSEPDIEELDIDPARTDAVRLMNLHQVKGLEAPVVFLIDPVKEHEFATELYVDRSGEESRGHILITRAWGQGTKDLAVPRGWDGYKATEKEFRRAESMRLLYVAATRARRMLVVGFRQTAKGLGGAWRELASRVRERLTMPPEIAATPAAQPPAVQQFAAARGEIAARFAAAKETSYSVLPITKIAHASHAELVRAEEGLGKGMSWGRVLHRLFEAMLRDESLDVRLYAENLLKDEERDVVELPDVMRVVEAVQSSPLWQRVKSADERYVEVPFAIEVPATELGLPPSPANTLLHGAIDLVFREGGEWFIVDYKSDSTAGRLDALTAYYTPQVRHYAQFWSRLTGAPARGGLFFVDGLVEKWVN